MTWFLLLLFARGIDSQGLSFCGAGWTFEKSCLGLSFSSAYVDGKNDQPAQCVIALEDASAVSTQIENQCAQIKDKRGVSAVPFDSTSGSVDQLEKYFALKQTGFYYAAAGKQVIPTSGKKTDVQGYLCSLKDTFGCSAGWFRYGSHCYFPRNTSRPYGDAQNDCLDKQGTLPRIVNDDENKFVASCVWVWHNCLALVCLPRHRIKCFLCRWLTENAKVNGDPSSLWESYTNVERFLRRTGFPQEEKLSVLAREQIFKDALGKNEIWGPLQYFPDDNLWQYSDLDTPDRKVLYMRWWSTASGTYSVINKPSAGYVASTIFTGRNDKDRTAYFGYWGTSKPTESKQYICRRPLHQI